MEIETARLAEFAAALRPRIAGDLRLDALHRALYATDASLYRERPLGVLLPRSADDIQAALEAGAAYGVPIVARGSGSSLAGSAVSAGLIVDTTRYLDQIVALDPEARTATVQPGVVLDDLNRAAAAHGLTVGPDPASSSRATLGGMLGTNATGTHSIQYGAMVDWTESVRVLLADGTPATFAALSEDAWAGKSRQSGAEGELYTRVGALLQVHEHPIRQDTPRWWRRAGGYRLERLMEAPEIDRGPGRAWDGTRNLASLLAGSEGTLAVATELTVGLVERPAHAALAVVHYPSRQAALEAVEGILETGPTAVELFDRIALARALDVAEYAPKLHFVQRGPHGELPAALLIVEYSGASLAECRDGLAGLRRHLGHGAVVTELEDETRMADVYAVRKVGLGLAMSARLPVQAAAIIEDAAVPVAHLPAYIAALEEALAADQIEAVMYAHASAGCLHVRPFFDLRQPAQVAAMDRVAQNPVLGHGWGVQVTHYSLVSAGTRSWAFLHNGYVALWFKLGLWGLGLMLVTWLATLARGLWALWTERLETDERALLAGSVATLAVLLLTASTSNPFSIMDQMLLLGLLLGGASGVAQRAQDRRLRGA